MTADVNKVPDTDTETLVSECPPWQKVFAFISTHYGEPHHQQEVYV